MTPSQDIPKRAFRFVFMIGVVSLFADLTYEGARSITGPFLGSLGASATIIGFVAGFGELVGYGLRAFSGYFADKTHRYWLFAFMGYAINMLAVPALALAGNWPMAAFFMIMERTGRAIRRPVVATMISYAGKSIGQGWVFGLHEALDQTGATFGPLLVALVLYLKGGYRHAFAVLLISALLCLFTLAMARWFHPRPHEMEERRAHLPEAKGVSRAYWIYLAAGALVAAGFADFSLVAFHFQKTGAIPQSVIPVFYAAAMAAGGGASLLWGWLFDKKGFPIVLTAFFLSAFFAPCVFAGSFALALVGMILWGMGMGAQDSLLKAALVGVIPSEKRSTAFGVFDMGFGLAWFAGSAVMGLLYDRSLFALIIFSVALQLLALPVFIAAQRSNHGRRLKS